MSFLQVDGYTTKTGFPLTATDQLDYLSFLSTIARSMGMAVGLKNSPDLANDVVAKFDFVVSGEWLSTQITNTEADEDAKPHH